METWTTGQDEVEAVSCTNEEKHRDLKHAAQWLIGSQKVGNKRLGQGDDNRITFNSEELEV